MSSGTVAKYVADTAFSFTLAENTGISPFLCMFLIGMVGRFQPEYLNLNDTMHTIMASWPSLVFWGISTILELVGKCVPVIDQIMDSVEAFIVPVLSTLGSFSAMNSFGDVVDIAVGEDDGNAAGGDVRRGLTTSTESIASTTIAFLQFLLVFFGVILALSLHFLKMLIRLIGEGCLTQLITIMEVTTVLVSVLVSIFVRKFAIFSACILFMGAFYNAKKRYERRQAEARRQEKIDAHKQKHVEEGVQHSPSGDYGKMDEAGQFLHMFRLKR